MVSLLVPTNKLRNRRRAMIEHVEFFASLICFLLLVPPVVALPPGFIGTYHPATGHVNDAAP